MVTVIYYTANREPVSFENKIRDKLLKSIGDLPLISVSHKPIDFGKNICVGEKFPCDANAFRQLRIGLEQVNTPYAIAAEADFIYPSEYFRFVPPTLDTVYRFQEVWILHMWGSDVFYQKKFSEGAQMAGRDFWIKSIDRVLNGRPEWSESTRPKPSLIFDPHNYKTWVSDIPCISVKTGYGLRRKTSVLDNVNPVESLPYWGSAKDLKNELQW